MTDTTMMTNDRRRQQSMTKNNTKEDAVNTITLSRLVVDDGARRTMPMMLPVLVDVDVMMVMEIERRCVVVVDVRTIRVCVVHVRQSSMKRLI